MDNMVNLSKWCITLAFLGEKLSGLYVSSTQTIKVVSSKVRELVWVILQDLEFFDDLV